MLGPPSKVLIAVYYSPQKLCGIGPQSCVGSQALLPAPSPAVPDSADGECAMSRQTTKFALLATGATSSPAHGAYGQYIDSATQSGNDTVYLSQPQQKRQQRKQQSPGHPVESPLEDAAAVRARPVSGLTAELAARYAECDMGGTAAVSAATAAADDLKQRLHLAAPAAALLSAMPSTSGFAVPAAPQVSAAEAQSPAVTVPPPPPGRLDRSIFKPFKAPTLSQA